MICVNPIVLSFGTYNVSVRPFLAQVSSYRAQWAEHSSTFLLQFGALKDVDLSQEISPNFKRTSATEPAHSDNFAKVQLYPNVQKLTLALYHSPTLIQRSSVLVVFTSSLPDHLLSFNTLPFSWLSAYWKCGWKNRLSVTQKSRKFDNTDIDLNFLGNA